MEELVTRRGEYIRASASEIWRALTDPEMSQQYLGARVHSTWLPGDEIGYYSPDGSMKLTEGTIVEALPNRRLVFMARHLFDPAFAAEKPHRETFEIEEFGEVCRLTAIFDQYEPNSASYGFACDTRGGMEFTGSSIKSLLETGTPIHREVLGAKIQPAAAR